MATKLPDHIAALIPEKGWADQEPGSAVRWKKTAAIPAHIRTDVMPRILMLALEATSSEAAAFRNWIKQVLSLGLGSYRGRPFKHSDNPSLIMQRALMRLCVELAPQSPLPAKEREIDLSHDFPDMVSGQTDEDTKYREGIWYVGWTAIRAIRGEWTVEAETYADQVAEDSGAVRAAIKAEVTGKPDSAAVVAPPPTDVEVPNPAPLPESKPLTRSGRPRRAGEDRFGFALNDDQQRAMAAIVSGWGRAMQAQDELMKLINSGKMPEDVKDKDYVVFERRLLWRKALVVAGAAGVGKSYTVSRILMELFSQLGSSGKSFGIDRPFKVATATFTHVAAKVLRDYLSNLLIGQIDPLLREQGIGSVVETEIVIKDKIKKMGWLVKLNNNFFFVARPTTINSTFQDTIDAAIAPAIEKTEEEKAKEAAKKPKAKKGKPDSKVGAAAQAAEDETLRADAEDRVKPASVYDFALIDEASMVPKKIYRQLLTNCAHPFLFIGDPAQLPPIGDRPPDTLTQLIAAGFATELMLHKALPTSEMDSLLSAHGEVAAFGNLLDARSQRVSGPGSEAILDLAYKFRQHIELPRLVRNGKTDITLSAAVPLKENGQEHIALNQYASDVIVSTIHSNQVQTVLNLISEDGKFPTKAVWEAEWKRVRAAVVLQPKFDEKEMDYTSAVRAATDFYEKWKQLPIDKRASVPLKNEIPTGGVYGIMPADRASAKGGAVAVDEFVGIFKNDVARIRSSLPGGDQPSNNTNVNISFNAMFIAGTHALRTGLNNCVRKALGYGALGHRAVASMQDWQLKNARRCLSKEGYPVEDIAPENIILRKDEILICESPKRFFDRKDSYRHEPFPKFGSKDSAALSKSDAAALAGELLDRGNDICRDLEAGNPFTAHVFSTGSVEINGEPADKDAICSSGDNVVVKHWPRPRTITNNEFLFVKHVIDPVYYVPLVWRPPYREQSAPPAQSEQGEDATGMFGERRRGQRTGYDLDPEQLPERYKNYTFVTTLPFRREIGWTFNGVYVSATRIKCAYCTVVNTSGEEFNVFVPHTALRASPKQTSVWERYRMYASWAGGAQTVSGGPLQQLATYYYQLLGDYAKSKDTSSESYAPVISAAPEMAALALWAAGRLPGPPNAPAKVLKDLASTGWLDRQKGRTVRLMYGRKPYAFNQLNDAERLMYGSSYGLDIPNPISVAIGPERNDESRDGYEEWVREFPAVLDAWKRSGSNPMRKPAEPRPAPIFPEYSDLDLWAALEMNAYQKAPFLLAHFAYCITGHASQGSQFKNVFAFMHPSNMSQYCDAIRPERRTGTDSDDDEAVVGNENAETLKDHVQTMLRWLYVVVTRAASKFNMLSNLECGNPTPPCTPAEPPFEILYGFKDSCKSGGGGSSKPNTPYRGRR